MKCVHKLFTNALLVITNYLFFCLGYAVAHPIAYGYAYGIEMNNLYNLR